MKDLMLRWGDTRSAWQDAVAEEFEEQVLAALERELRTTTGAMDSMSQLLSQAKIDCR